jgi:hypothetical protein
MVTISEPSAQLSQACPRNRAPGGCRRRGRFGHGRLGHVAADADMSALVNIETKLAITVKAYIAHDSSVTTRPISFAHMRRDQLRGGS